MLLVCSITFIKWRNPSFSHGKQLKNELASPSQSESKQPSEGVLDQEMRSNFLFLVQDRVKEQALYRDSDLIKVYRQVYRGARFEHVVRVNSLP